MVQMEPDEKQMQNLIVLTLWKALTMTSERIVLSLFSDSIDYGPMFIQEPDNVIFPVDSDEKKVSLSCQARGNPAPNYR